MASAGERAYSGVCGAEPQEGFKGSAPGQRVWGRIPQKLIAFRGCTSIGIGKLALITSIHVLL